MSYSKNAVVPFYKKGIMKDNWGDNNVFLCLTKCVKIDKVKVGVFILES